MWQSHYPQSRGWEYTVLSRSSSWPIQLFHYAIQANSGRTKKQVSRLVDYAARSRMIQSTYRLGDNAAGSAKRGDLLVRCGPSLINWGCQSMEHFPACSSLLLGKLAKFFHLSRFFLVVCLLIGKAGKQKLTQLQSFVP